MPHNDLLDISRHILYRYGDDYVVSVLAVYASDIRALRALDFNSTVQYVGNADARK